MGLRCLLGHDFGDPEIERERREDGNEMVVTVREIRTCDRCGERQILSENKEVTSIRTPAELGLDESGGTETADASEAQTATETPADAAETGDADAASVSAPSDADVGVEVEKDEADAGADADAETPEVQAAAETAPDAAETDDDGAPTEDDGVILDDSPSTRTRGEWPDPDGDGESSTTEAKAEAGATETGLRGAAETATREEIERGEFVGENVTDDAEFIDADEQRAADADESAADASAATQTTTTTPDDGQVAWPEHEHPAAPERESGGATEWPEHESEDEGFAAGSVDDDVEVSLGGNELTPEVTNRPTSVDAADTGEDFVRDGDAPAPTNEGRSPGESARAVFYCPNCSFRAPVARSSVRAGDICPECRRGYIAERDE